MRTICFGINPHPFEIAWVLFRKADIRFRSLIAVTGTGFGIKNKGQRISYWKKGMMA